VKDFIVWVENEFSSSHFHSFCQCRKILVFRYCNVFQNLMYNLYLCIIIIIISHLPHINFLLDLSIVSILVYWLVCILLLQWYFSVFVFFVWFLSLTCKSYSFPLVLKRFSYIEKGNRKVCASTFCYINHELSNVIYPDFHLSSFSIFLSNSLPHIPIL